MTDKEPETLKESTYESKKIPKEKTIRTLLTELQTSKKELEATKAEAGFWKLITKAGMITVLGAAAIGFFHGEKLIQRYAPYLFPSHVEVTVTKTPETKSLANYLNPGLTATAERIHQLNNKGEETVRSKLRVDIELNSEDPRLAYKIPWGRTSDYNEIHPENYDKIEKFGNFKTRMYRNGGRADRDFRTVTNAVLRLKGPYTLVAVVGSKAGAKADGSNRDVDLLVLSGTNVPYTRTENGLFSNQWEALSQDFKFSEYHDSVWDYEQEFSEKLQEGWQRKRNPHFEALTLFIRDLADYREKNVIHIVQPYIQNKENVPYDVETLKEAISKGEAIIMSVGEKNKLLE
jgi:hypothetical protein